MINYKDLTSTVLFSLKGKMFTESLQHQATKINSPSTRHKIVHRMRHSGASNTSVANTACDHGILDTLLSDLNVFSTALSLCVLFFLSRIKEGRGSHRAALCFQRCHENVTLLNCGNKTHPEERALRIFTRKQKPK